MSKLNRTQFKLETDLLSLRSLVAIVEEGSFSAAAKRVNRTQSAISLQIAKLEERLNTKLLERTSRTITVTPAGETFVSYARRIIELADEAMLAISAPEESTLLRVGFAQSLVPQQLPTLLARFRRANPHCDLSLMLGAGAELLTMLEHEELDLVFAAADADKGQVLWEEQLVWSGVNNLADDPCAPVELILIHPPCHFRQIAFKVLTKAAIPWKVSIDANSVQAVQSAIRAGLGVSILPRSAVQADMPIVTQGLPELPNTAVMSYLNTNQTHPYRQRFIDFLLACIKDGAESHRHMMFYDEEGLSVGNML